VPREIQFRVPNIVCGSCVGIIEHIFTRAEFNALPVLQISASETTYVSMTLDDTHPLPSDTQIKKIIAKELDDVSFVVDFEKEETFPGEETFPSEPEEVEKNKTLNSNVAKVSKEKRKSLHLIRNYLIKGAIGTIFGVGLLIMCAGGFGLPMYAMYLLAGLSSALSLYLGKDTYKAAWGKFVKTKTLTMDTLFTVSTLTAIGVSVASLFVSWLPMMFDAALLIFGFRYLGMAIEEKVKRKIIRNVLFKDKIPNEVEIEKDGRREKISIRNLKIGDVIVMRKGDIIPVDSVCKENFIHVDASIYTGNSRLLIHKDEPLFGGMVLLDKEATLLVQKTASDPTSFLTQADKKLETTRKQKAPVEEIADKILKYFVPIVFGLTIISGICIGLLFTPALALQCVISMLVSACPCTLGFIVPLSVKIGITKGIENGIQFSSGKYLQEAAKINAMVFDLNGTLTQGTPEVTSLKSTHRDISENDIKKYLNILEKKSEHAIGRTIYQHTIKREMEEGSDVVDEVTDVATTSNSGISKKINGVTYTVGNSTMLKNAAIPIKTTLAALSLQRGEHVVYLAREAEVIGYAVVRDSLRDDARLVINELQKKNIEIFLCTGADKATAGSFARELNIKAENVDADCLPFASDSPTGEKPQHSKVDFIHSLQSKGYKVGMVGDANNDAFAMAKSDVGFAIYSHSNGDVARDNAGALVKGASLLPVLYGLVIAKQTIRNIKQNLAISLMYNMTALLIAGGLLLAIGFALNPAIGVALMVLQTCLVLLSVYYLKRKQLPNFTHKLPVVTQTESNTHTTLNKRFQSISPKPSEKLCVKKENSSVAPLPRLTRFSNTVRGLFTKVVDEKVNIGLTPNPPSRFIPGR
jgi:Cu2+-exporting ATPase